MSTVLIYKIIGGVFLAFISLWGYNLIKNHFIGVQNLEMALANKTVEWEREKISRISLEIAAEKEAEIKARIAVIRKSSTAAIDKARTETQKYKDVLADRERIARLSKAKPKTLEKLGNRATKKRMSDLEAVFNN